MKIATVLGDFFERVGRRIWLACELPVLYPDEAPLAPDLIAVAEMEDPGDDDSRMAWVVAEEGRSVDLAMEITYRSRRQKDLVSNVARYARLGIPEYFVYDRLKQRLHGYRLAGVDTRYYQSIPQHRGLLRSAVLGLELGVVEGRLRFFYGDAQIPESRELIGRLDAMMAERERRLEEEIALRREAEERAARADEAEARAARAEQAQAELERRLAALLAERGGGS